MKNILIFESFISNKITSLLRYLSKSESNKILSDLRSIMLKYDYPISNIDDISISYNKRKDALNLIPESGFYIKYWFNANGNLIAKTITKPEKEKLLQVKELTIDSMVFNKNDFPKPNGYHYLYSCSRNSSPSDYTKWFETGDKIYILCCNISEYDAGDTLPAPVEATIFIREGGSIYAIQNLFDGSPAGSYENWRMYGQYSWCLGSRSDIMNDHIIIAVKDPKESMMVSSALYVNEYNTDDDLASTDYISIIDNSDFAITIKMSDLIEDEPKLSNIKGDRISRKSGSTALMSDSEILSLKSINRNQSK